jgi:hypothetical protein
MPTFILMYRAPQGYQVGTPEGAAAWNAWFQSIGPDLVDIGRPVGKSATVGNCGDGSQAFAGYSLIRSDDLEGALAIAKGCPFVDSGGGAEVGELLDLPGAPAASEEREPSDDRH